MTYFGVLATFVVPPSLILLALVPRDLWRWLLGRTQRVDWRAYLVVLAHIGMALIYTTPWDNYLVATGVWWYHPDLVTGVTLGWVPIEEYTFFVVQTLLTGLWTLALMRLVARDAARASRNNNSSRPYAPGQKWSESGATLRRWASLLLLGVWVVSTLLLVLGWRPGTYLTLILSWALIPVLIQVAFGADILFAHWRSLLPAVAAPTLYLWWVDALALAGGTWSINPLQTTGLKLGPLPLEEMLFFLMTNLIIGFGVTLMLAEASQPRARAMLAWLKARGAKPGGVRRLRRKA